jgi:hypothetical protein
MPFAYYREARGFFGWVFLIMFFSLKAFMALLLWRVWTIAGEADSWTGLIMFFWVCGAVITGSLALVTRGRRIY